MGEFLTRRIYGLETEFGVACVSGGQRRLSPDEVARHLFRGVVAWGRSSNVFLGNGARMYLDVGSHPEYATAECDNLTELVAQDRAGERLFLHQVELARRKLAEEGVQGDIYLFKNNTDFHGNSYGCHENYLVGRTRELSPLTAVLLPFLISRQLVVGAGKVLRGGQFVVSQRAAHMWDSVSSATTRMRPMINTRDEPHADPAQYRRLHVIVGDSNMSETTTWLKVGMTELVLRVIESGTALHDFTLENATSAIRELSREPFGRRKVSLANGRSITGLELQQEYLGAVEDLIARTGDPGEELRDVVTLWRRVLQALESGDYSLIERDIDWVIKHRLLHRYADRHGLAFDDSRIAQLDLAYHDIMPGRGLFSLLAARGNVSRVVDDAAIEVATTTPPQTTRARLRGRFVTAAMAAGVDYTVDWTTLKLNQPSRTWRPPGTMTTWEPHSPTTPPIYAPVLCKDPFRAVDDRVEQLLDHLAANDG